MNGTYALERIVDAIMAANKEYLRNHPSSTAPEQSFYMEFLEPFIERETRQAKLDENHLQTSGVVRKRERELVDSIKYWNGLCEKRVHGADKQKEKGKL